MNNASKNSDDDKKSAGAMIFIFVISATGLGLYFYKMAQFALEKWQKNHKQPVVKKTIVSNQQSNIINYFDALRQR